MFCPICQKPAYNTVSENTNTSDHYIVMEDNEVADFDCSMFECSADSSHYFFINISAGEEEFDDDCE